MLSDPNDDDGTCAIVYGTKPPNIDVCFTAFNFDALECLTELPAVAAFAFRGRFKAPYGFLEIGIAVGLCWLTLNDMQMLKQVGVILTTAFLIVRGLDNIGRSANIKGNLVREAMWKQLFGAEST